MKNKPSEEFEIWVTKELTSLRRINTLLFSLLLLLFLGTITSGFTSKKNTPVKSLRVQELIIEDANGNERIILASQITAYISRHRKDTLSGILILDKNGRDRVLVGASPTYQKNGKLLKRSSSDVPYGMVFNNENGDERGGFGYYSDRKVAALGIDGPGGEGIAMFVPEKELFGQKVGMIVNDPQKGGQLIYLGSSVSGQTMLLLDTPGKGRISHAIDSTANFEINHSLNEKSKKLLSTKE